MDITRWSIVKVKVKQLSRVRHLATPWTAAYQAPPSMGFSRQEYWSGVPLPSPLITFAAAAAAKSLQSCLTLCDPIDGSPPDSPVPGILQARTLEWSAIAFSDNKIVNITKRKHSQRQNKPVVTSREREGQYVAAAAKLLQSSLTLCDPIDGSPPDSPIPGILQARTLEWVAISFSNA